jgi:mRNA interferase MazF
MAKSSIHRLGSIWLVAFDPSVGTEIRKTRPALIVSGTVFNEQRSKVTVLPFTSAKLSEPKISPAVVVIPASIALQVVESANLGYCSKHYLNSGIGEGRQVLFDPQAYLDRYGDLKTAFGDNLRAATRHFIESGYGEGRSWLG